MKKLLFTLLFLTLGAAWGGAYEDGSAAFERNDYVTAIKLWRPLAEQGNASIQDIMGAMYKEGLGVTQDYKEAVKWWKLAAEQGYASAQTSLGVRYEKGQGVTQNYKEAVRLYRLAAEQGDVSAQYNLGLMYYKGYGVLQDYAHAHMWLNLASAAGDADGIKSRDIIAKEMTPQQIEKAQEMAKACQAPSLKGCGMKPLSSDELLVNNLNISEAEFSKQFQCPEYLSNDRGRESAIDYMMQWLGANSRTPVTPVSLVAFRMKMLTEHHCETTLNNIHQNFNNDLQQENIKISQKIVSDIARRFKGVMEESGISGVTADVQKCYDDALSKSNEQELIRSCMLYDKAAKALDIGFGKAIVARVGKDPGPANAYLSNKAYKTRIEIYTKIAFKGYTDAQVINYFGDYPSKLIDRLIVR